MSGAQVFGRTLFGLVDHVATNILLPISGLLITVFAGWVMCRNSSADELDVDAGGGYGSWRFLARWVAPAAVLLVFLYAAGVLDLLGLV